MARRIRDNLAEAEADVGEDRLRVRVGVTTGEPWLSVSGERSVDAVGDVAHTAARPESAATVDGVLVDGWAFPGKGEAWPRGSFSSTAGSHGRT